MNLFIFSGAITSLGFKLRQSYYDPILLKTDCPPEFLYNIVKIYKKQLSTKESDYIRNVKEGSYRFKILSKEPFAMENLKFVDVDIRKDAPRYLPHPIKYWGPKGRAKEIVKIIKK